MSSDPLRVGEIEGLIYFPLFRLATGLNSSLPPPRARLLQQAVSFAISETADETK